MSTPKINVYHYAHLSDWTSIATGDVFRKIPTGLVPQHTIGAANKEASQTKAVFGFLTPEPQNWMKNPDFTDIWNRLGRELGDLLLEIEINPYTDGALVADRGYIEGYLYQDKTGIPKHYIQDSREPAERNYMESRVPLLDYVNQAETLRYSLPEVLIPNHVSLDQISIFPTQPRLEQTLKRYPEGGLLYQKVFSSAQEIPGLTPWHTDYQVRQQRAKEGRPARRERG